MADYFLKVDGIPGESADAKHKDEIDVLAFSWGVSQAGAASSGGGGASGKAAFDDLLVVARTSKASPQLWLACAEGKHIKSAVLTCRRGGKAPVEFLTIVLSDVVVSSYEVDGSDEERRSTRSRSRTPRSRPAIRRPTRPARPSRRSAPVGT